MLLVLKMVNGARSASEPNLASWVADDESHFLALQRVLEMVGAETVESALEKPALWRAIDAGSAAGADAAADGTKLTSPNAAQTSTPERTRPAVAAAAAAASPGQPIPTAVAKRSTANSVSDTDAYFTPPASPGRELFSDGAAPGADDTICADTLDESLVSSVCGEEPVAGFWPPNGGEGWRKGGKKEKIALIRVFSPRQSFSSSHDDWRPCGWLRQCFQR